MTVDENTSNSTGNLQDTITGISPRVAEALSHIGIHRLDDLAESTPGELAKALRGMGIYRKRIEVENWIAQAKQKLAERKEEASSSPEADTTAMPNAQASGHQLGDWNLQAEFTLYFENKAFGQGEETWQTRVWKTRVRDRECDKEITFDGIKPHLWVNWILQQADLPNDIESELIAPEALVSPTPVTPKPAQVDIESELIAPEALVSPTPVTPKPAQVLILDVQIEPQSPSDVRNSRLVSSIHFTVSGANAKTLTAENTPYQIMVHAMDLGSGVTKLLASEHSQFQPEQSVHIYRLEQPIPDLRRYELQTTVLIESQPELMAVYRGPIINVAVPGQID